MVLRVILGTPVAHQSAGFDTLAESQLPTTLSKGLFLVPYPYFGTTQKQPYHLSLSSEGRHLHTSVSQFPKPPLDSQQTCILLRHKSTRLGRLVCTISAKLAGTMSPEEVNIARVTHYRQSPVLMLCSTNQINFPKTASSSQSCKGFPPL